MLENASGQLPICRESRYINGAQSELVRQYNWGLKWKGGHKA